MELKTLSVSMARISTSHLRETTIAWLESKDCPLPCEEVEQGFLLCYSYVSDYLTHAENKIPGELHYIMLRAVKAGIEWVWLDAGHRIVEDLPLFDNEPAVHDTLVARLRASLEAVLPYAQSRAEDLAEFKANGTEDPNFPGADEAEAACKAADDLLRELLATED